MARPASPIDRKTPAGRLGARIRAARERTGKTGCQCASNLGVAPITWSRWEHGLAGVSVARLGRIARVLGLAPGDLLG